jgi:hypothetical protein
MSTPRNLLIGLAIATIAVPPAAALAKDGDVRRQGECTGSSTSKIKLSPDDGRIETEFEVDQNRNGVRWKVTIRRNGKRALSTHATTRGPSGSFSVERRLADGSGADTFVARAVSPSGETCTARATL